MAISRIVCPTGHQVLEGERVGFIVPALLHCDDGHFPVTEAQIELAAENIRLKADAARM